MTDEQATEEALETLSVWIAKTLGYVILAVFAGVVLTNAVVSFFFEGAHPGIGGGLGSAIGAAVAARRRHLLKRKQ